MTVAISISEGQAYTWESAWFAWDDAVIGNRELQSLAVLGYAAAVASPLGIAEGRGFAIDLQRAESFGVYSVARRAATVQVAEPIKIRELAARQADKSLAESLSLQELRSFGTNVRASERLALQSRRGWHAEKVASEAIFVQDRFDRSVAFTIAFSRALQFAGKAGKHVLLPKDKDGFSISDAQSKNIALDCRRLLALGETYTDQIGFMLSFVETLSVASRKGNEVRLPQAESFGFTDGGARSLEKTVLRDLLIGEQFGRTSTFTLKLFQLIYMGSDWRRDSVLTKNEYFGVASKSVRAIHKHVQRALSFYEELSRTMTFRRYLVESMSLTDGGSRHVKLSVKEFVALYDGIRRAGDMVVSDMILSSELMDAAGFAHLVAYGNVPGYERWRDFIPGDYEYREAMFRTVIESKNSDRGMLASMQVTVDVPDLIERGSTTVSVAAVGGIVTFQRKFHIVPEITMAIKGGVGLPAVPRITSVTKEGFTFVLEDAREGTFRTGVATWAAHGY